MVLVLLAGAVPKWFGSQPYRRLSGDCLRVLTRLRLVKPGFPQRTARTLKKDFRFGHTHDRVGYHNEPK
ncbi:hypothetical protein B8W69_04715 [Mycobacterium vulneris]|uniref:Uncharacterized protein n=1 Tax=Mycolicibacterium vulneris TaxID=547163 RepID=A0A1X2LDZ4_9MYCO|nr:hypothetical protein B8W69_04715 [Mycolicibacterium vulneris]